MCEERVLCLALDVNVDSMLKKAKVLGAVMRDGPTLRRKVSDYDDVHQHPVACTMCAIS